MWDARFDERDVKEIRTKTTTYLGVGAIAKMDNIAADLKARGIDSILCVTAGIPTSLPAHGITSPQPAPSTAYASPCTTR